MATDVTTSGEQLLQTSPVFRVADVEAAAEYCRDRLGFSYARFWGEPPSFCLPARDGVHVALEPDDVRPNGAGGHGWDAYVWVADADALFAEYEDAGASIRDEPTVKEAYGMREFTVSDLDGYVLAFGEDVE
jgi:predicted enzyme related to lactoylglutathione lyase